MASGQGHTLGPVFEENKKEQNIQNMKRKENTHEIYKRKIIIGEKRHNKEEQLNKAVIGDGAGSYIVNILQYIDFTQWKVWTYYIWACV